MTEPAYDLVIRGGQLGDIAVGDGRIQAIGVIREAGREEINAAGLHIYPGYIDAHVHFNDPGRADWEGRPGGPSLPSFNWRVALLNVAAKLCTVSSHARLFNFAPCS